ncbi:ATP-binding protein [Streptomyces sp. CWNU-52B]|uniref:ATP-binding protein n=1 Tax=unclassified Streptomyces TaxID=2593676 RepID=UPI0039C06FEA
MRWLTARWLTAHGLTELDDRGELLTSELATNSVRHAKGPASVRLQWLHPVPRVSVWDMGPDLPALPRCPLKAQVETAEEHAYGGRGMVILSTVADRWGGCAESDHETGPQPHPQPGDRAPRGRHADGGKACGRP